MGEESSALTEGQNVHSKGQKNNFFFKLIIFFKLFYLFNVFLLSILSYSFLKKNLKLGKTFEAMKRIAGRSSG